MLDTKAVDVPANGRATVEFHSLEVPYGFSRCEVRIDSNTGIKEDDRFLFAVERTDPRQLLFVHEARDARGLLYFVPRSILRRTQPFAWRQSLRTSGRIEPGRFPVVVLSDVGVLPEGFEQKLLQHVRKGGAVMVTAGTMTSSQLRIPVFGGKIVDSRYAARSEQRFQSAVAVDSASEHRHTTGLESVKFYRVVQADPRRHA